jgi:hypothetical protein
VAIVGKGTPLFVLEDDQIEPYVKASAVVGAG